MCRSNSRFVLKCNRTPCYKTEIADIVTSDPMSRSQAVAAFELQLSKERLAGSKIKNNSPMEGTVRRAEVESVTGKPKAIYLVEAVSCSSNGGR
jgi:hypothetical protein